MALMGCISEEHESNNRNMNESVIREQKTTCLPNCWLFLFLSAFGPKQGLLRPFQQSQWLTSGFFLISRAKSFRYTGWTEDHRNFEAPLISGIGWQIWLIFHVLKVQWIRFGLVYKSLGYLHICLRKKWSKLGNVSKCRFSDTFSLKITFESWNLKSCLKPTCNIYQGHWPYVR